MINRTINEDSILHHVSSDIVTSKTNDLLRYFEEDGYYIWNVEKTISLPEFKEFLCARYNWNDLAIIAGFLKRLEEISKTGKLPSDDDSFSLSEEEKVYDESNGVRLEVIQSLIEKTEGKLRTIEDKLKTLEGYKFVFNDGGRSKYFKGRNVGDCVTRAIAIASDQDYKIIYDDLKALTKEYIKNHNNKSSRAMEKQGNRSVRWGTSKTVYHPYLLEQGWTWTPTNYIGQKHKVYLQVDDLPKGRLIVQIRKHLTVVEDGCLYDTWDCSYLKTPMVYGYYMKPQIGGEQ